MAARTLGNRVPAAPAPQYQPAPAYGQPQRTATAPAPSQARGGLPPPPSGWTPPAPGSGFTKRTDKEWEEHPLRDGEYEFDVYVTKIVEWSAGGVTVTLRVSQWDRDANRSGPHHTRPLRWDQQPRKSLLARLEDPADKKASTTYGDWRHDLVTCYTGVGHPEETWERTGEGESLRVWAPHDRFFVQAIGGVSVPIMMHAKVRAWSMRGDSGRFSEPFRGLDVKSLEVIRAADGRPYQAMLPREVPRRVADLHRWRVAEERDLPNGLAKVVLLDKDCVTFPFNNLPTYKDL